MNDELFALVQLQDADEEIRRIRAEIGALPKQLASLEEKLIWQKARIDQAEKTLKEEESKRRRLESDLKDLQQKIVKFREQSSSVKTNEQFHALQHEISFAEGEISKIGDRELESMERSDELQAQLATARHEFADNATVVNIEKDAAREKTEEKQKHLETLNGERTKLRGQISEKNLADYDRIAGSRGTALARVDGQRCMACQMALRPQLWNEVRGGRLVPCESCGRLLYFDNEKPHEPDALPSTLKNKAAAGA
jgi:uncharacterized protein